MCTLIILNRASPLAPVIIAANRDEFYDRPARPPEPLADARAIAGIDEDRGGSWMGATASGLFVGLTNQRTFAAPDPARESRGRVVLDCLRRGDHASAHALLANLDGRRYNPFNLLVGDAARIECAYVRDEGVSFEAVAEGISILPNDRLDSPEFTKVDRARALVGDVGELDWPSLIDRLVTALGDHRMPEATEIAPPPVGSRLDAELVARLHALCVHTPLYGTRSFTVAALGPGRVARYLFGDGTPCTSTPRDLTHLFATL